MVCWSCCSSSGKSSLCPLFVFVFGVGVAVDVAVDAAVDFVVAVAVVVVVGVTCVPGKCLEEVGAVGTAGVDGFAVAVAVAVIVAVGSVDRVDKKGSGSGSQVSACRGNCRRRGTLVPVNV